MRNPPIHFLNEPTLSTPILTGLLPSLANQTTINSSRCVMKQGADELDLTKVQQQRILVGAPARWCGKLEAASANAHGER